MKGLFRNLTAHDQKQIDADRHTKFQRAAFLSLRAIASPIARRSQLTASASQRR